MATAVSPRPGGGGLDDDDDGDRPAEAVDGGTGGGENRAPTRAA
ncbi:MAG: hypothetical protein ACODAE_07025 [Gemmatimonadota bacterium]